MAGMKGCIKDLELLDQDSQSQFIKKISNINKQVLPKSMLRSNTQKVEEEK
jgi:hypothetical protein